VRDVTGQGKIRLSLSNTVRGLGEAILKALFAHFFSVYAIRITYVL
jgi:hypothetical protein